MSFTCRRGHYSVSDDYCDVCGARNWNAGQRIAAGTRTAEASVAQTCPICATPREGSDRYCPSCAYDFETGQALEPEPAAVVSDHRSDNGGSSGNGVAEQVRLVLVLSVDPNRTNEPGCPQPPSDRGEHVFMLDRQSTVVGRDESAGVQIPIASDPYVSRRHAEIVDLGDAWGIRDLGSTNGTKLNGVSLVGTEVKLVRPDDVIELGCFSRLTIRRRTGQV